MQSFTENRVKEIEAVMAELAQEKAIHSCALCFYQLKEIFNHGEYSNLTIAYDNTGKIFNFSYFENGHFQNESLHYVFAKHNIKMTSSFFNTVIMNSISAGEMAFNRETNIIDFFAFMFPDYLSQYYSYHLNEKLPQKSQITKSQKI